ncbi:hypothetical protein FDECE_17717 [Fusarium decemcellulare]|nr:hypothetical protein FDECE_17717 [Fusarium decemcellulare]
MTMATNGPSPVLAKTAPLNSDAGRLGPVLLGPEMGDYTPDHDAEDAGTAATQEGRKDHAVRPLTGPQTAWKGNRATPGAADITYLPFVLESGARSISITLKPPRRVTSVAVPCSSSEVRSSATALAGFSDDP